MEIHYLNKFPNGYQAYGELSTLDEYDLNDLKDLNLDEIWYWYSTAPYEGSGQLLMRRGDLYDLHDAGHCSCYGPCERVKFVGYPLGELKSRINKEYFAKECRELFELAEIIS